MRGRNTGALVCADTTRSESFSALVFLPLVLFLVFSPFYDSIGLPVQDDSIMLMDWQRLSELLVVSLVLVVLCLSIFPVRAGFYLLSAVQLWGWLAFFVIGAISSAYAAHPRFAWIEWSWILVCGLTATLICVKSVRFFRSAGTITRLFSLAVLASYTPLYYIRNSDVLFESPSMWGPFFFGFNNVRVFSDCQTAVICVLPWALSRVWSSSLLRAGAWCLAGCYTALAFVAGSRSLMYGQLAACAALVLLLGWNNVAAYMYGQLRLWLLGGTVYVLLFVLYPAVFFDEKVTSWAGSLLRHDSSGRLDLWASAAKMALENPWFGIGPMHFAAVLNPIAASPHNQVFQVMAEFGIVAAILFVFLFSHWLFAVRRGMRFTQPSMTDDARVFSVSIFAALLALLAQSCVSPVFNNPHSQILLIFFGGMLGQYIKWPGNGLKQSIRCPVVVLAALVALGVFAVSCLPWALHIEERNACHFRSSNRPSPHLAPRFWQQGWLFIPCEPIL